MLVDKNAPDGVQDASLCLENMFNAAYALGLDSLVEAGYEGEYIGVGSCILGYPANGFPKPIKRKPNYYKIIR